MPQKQIKNSLIWFTTNLRTSDNHTLFKAIQNTETCWAVYCIDPSWFRASDLGFPKMGRFRTKFLLESLEDLATQLSELGIFFKVLIGKPEEVIPKYIAEHEISEVYLQKDWTTEEQQVLNQTKSECPDSITWHEYFDQFLIHPDDLPFSPEDLPFMFTEFRKQVEKSLNVRPEFHFPTSLQHEKAPKATIPSLEDLDLFHPTPAEHSAFPFLGGSMAAFDRLEHYFWKTDAIQSYKETRNGLVGLDYSSKISAWLALGCISPRSIYHALKKYENDRGANQSTYWLLFELLWRDFFKYVSLKFGDRIFQPHGIRSKTKNWSTDRSTFEKWTHGTTDSQFVNANMNELNSTGWMSNRGRQNVASYLTKTLGIDWRWGAAYFESLLIDYDVHSNYGNWMYVAGVGNDPRDRFFNVEKQAQQYDPEGKYQALWQSKTAAL